MAGAAIVIGLQQLKGLLGLSHFTNSTDIVSVIKAVCSALHDPVSCLSPWRHGNTAFFFLKEHVLLRPLPTKAHTPQQTPISHGHYLE